MVYNKGTVKNKGGAMKSYKILMLSILITFLFATISFSAERVVVCEEMYAEW